MRASPVILVGMHRSGTSVTMKALRDCGLFIGKHTTDLHCEARFFRRTNDAVIQGAGGEWHCPEPAVEAIRDPARRAQMVEQINRMLDRRLETQFLTSRQRLMVRLGIPFAWGFKDPRTCVTLPIWMERYPDAKVIHLIRHPLDVALSLQRREITRSAPSPREAPALNDLRRGLELWRLHDACVREAWPTVRHGLEMRFEEILDSPRACLARLVEFCELGTSPGRIARVAGGFDTTRRGRYLDGIPEEALAMAASLPAAVEYGYHRDLRRAGAAAPSA